MTGDTDLEHARRIAVDAAEAAGMLLSAGTCGTVEINSKGDHGDVVTNLDLAAEKLLLERVLTAFPGHAVIAEESGRLGETESEWTWVIDPLDGTNNVAIGLPLYAVGLALCRDGRPELGVVHEPVTGRTWSAIRGRGALGPGRPADHSAVPARRSRSRAGLDPGVRRAARRRRGGGAEGRAGRARPPGPETLGAAARLGDARPGGHRRDHRLPDRDRRPAGRPADRAGGRSAGHGLRRHALRRSAVGGRARLRREPARAPGRSAGAGRGQGSGGEQQRAHGRAARRPRPGPAPARTNVGDRHPHPAAAAPLEPQQDGERGPRGDHRADVGADQQAEQLVLVRPPGWPSPPRCRRAGC